MTEREIYRADFQYQFLYVYAKYNRLSTFVSIRDNPVLKGKGHHVFYQTAGGGPIEGYLSGFMDRNWVNNPIRVEKPRFDEPWNWVQERDIVAFFVWMRDGPIDLHPYVCLMDSTLVKQHLVEEFCLTADNLETLSGELNPYLTEERKREEIEANRQAALYFTRFPSSIYGFITHQHPSELLRQTASEKLNNCMEKIITRVIKKLPLHPEDA